MHTVDTVKTLAEQPVFVSINRLRFHRPTCKWTEHIHDSIRVEFPTREDAIALGFKPCQTCCA